MSGLRPAGLTPWKRTLPVRGTFSLGNSLRGRETISPYSESKFLELVADRLPSLPKKKKKKKKRKKRRRGWCGSGNYTRAVRWRPCERGGTEEGIVERAGRRVYTIGASLAASGE